MNDDRKGVQLLDEAESLEDAESRKHQHMATEVNFMKETEPLGAYSRPCVLGPRHELTQTAPAHPCRRVVGVCGPRDRVRQNGIVGRH